MTIQYILKSTQFKKLPAQHNTPTAANSYRSQIFHYRLKITMNELCGCLHFVKIDTKLVTVGLPTTTEIYLLQKNMLPQ